MKDTAADDTVVDRLKAALDGEAMPKAARDYAKHLLARLSQPVRVSVLGTPRSGKSELVNMFVGRRLIPIEAQLPTTEFVWGETEAMTVTAADGSIRRFDYIDLETLSGGSAAFLKLEIPADILRRINILEVVTNGAHEEIESAIDWAVRRTDIALWCSQTFNDLEQAVWSRVPDSLKDHAFLVLTKADVLSAENKLSTRVAELESVVAEEFHSLFAVATLQAVRAVDGGTVDEAMFHASGGGALTSEILRHAERGRRADFDSAHMFLARYQIRDIPRATRPANTPAPVSAEPVVEAPRAEAVTEPKPEVADLAAKPASPVAAEVAPAPEPAPPPEPEPVAESAPAMQIEEPALRLENTELFVNAVQFLKRRGDGLAETAGTLGEGATKPMVQTCVDAVEHLVDLFSQEDTGCPATDAFIDELAEASDMMVLMQVEEGDGPAADAVTLLLQLRRDMEMQLAA